MTINLNITFTLILYGALVILTHFKYKGRYRGTKPKLRCQILTMFLQPVMEVFFYSKITHQCHWKSIQTYSTDKYLTLKASHKRDFRDGNGTFFRFAWSELQPNREAFIIQPKNYDGYWFYSFCDQDNCKVSTINFCGPVKIIADNGLKVIDSIKVKTRTEYLYV